jgi:ubiquinone/menaquinone biosynthesis C-methylase UbiE
MGSLRQVANDIETMFRYNVLKVLSEVGLFGYLEESKTYGDILVHLGYADNAYMRELLDLLVNDEGHVLISDDNSYQLDPAFSLPTLDELFDQTDDRYHNFALVAEGLVRNIPARLGSEPVEFSQTFEAEGREMMQRFDRWLSIKMYTIGRNAAFALLTSEERRWLRGKSLLDVGCGSGAEVADLWTRLGGDIHITAIDPVTSLLTQAEASFVELVTEIDPDHPPITDANRPVFKEASATQLPYADASFDAAFYQHVLHWTSNPRRAISEIVRVIKPGGLIFGMQIVKPYAGGVYTDITFRSSENVNGTFWNEEHKRWYEESGIELEIATPIGVFRARKA